MHLYSLTIPRSDATIHLPAVADEEASTELTVMCTNFSNAALNPSDAAIMNASTPQRMTEEEVTTATPKTFVRSAAKIRGKETLFFYFTYLSSKAWDCPPVVPNAKPGDLFIIRISKAFGAAWSLSRCYPDERRQTWVLVENNGATSWKEIGVGYERMFGEERRLLNLSRTGVPAWITASWIRT
ncbi:hypothetical protein BD410DRAFT_845753 [Rickenella mellea]|uniref:Uncharacterized protein n=1 Tax=Rickenella mellea TaxID=50990 RepID=A0A4Y7PHK3_9AGAM|nr:hypothetical protein BD410DRAFT_845753 [Rickenella mellea]